MVFVNQPLKVQNLFSKSDGNEKLQERRFKNLSLSDRVDLEPRPIRLFLEDFTDEIFQTPAHLCPGGLLQTMPRGEINENLCPPNRYLLTSTNMFIPLNNTLSNFLV